MSFQLKLPVKDIFVTQPFGVNFVNFYTNLGLDGHNGIDFRARTGCKVYAAHDGLVVYSNKDSGGGEGIEIATTIDGPGYKTIYYHLEKRFVEESKEIKAGDLIGYADNTGKYTTGDHLHFGLKRIFNGVIIDFNNGFKGAIDPAPFFPKNWDKSNSYHRYGRKQNWLAEWKMRFKNPWLHRQLIKKGLNPILGIEPINALVYGGWDFDSVINPAMFEIWGWCKKDEFVRGKINFLS